ncbi:MAG: minor capsid protein, partial [Caenispirillum sp.]|nr:minor capsid protein [Caenispirillum sp.]
MAEPRLQPLPFTEAIQALKARDRERLPSGHWSSVWEAEHAVAFTVARSSGFDILSDIHESLTKALSEGTTFETWKKDITPVLQAKGWWGKREIDGELVQLGSPRRLATIFQVNMRVSYMAGKWEQIQRLKDRRPWLRYVAVLDERTRANHRSLHGTVLPVDHPFWDSHFPPNGWRCRCTVEQLSDRDLARYGYRPTDPPPPVRLATWRRPATGDIVVTPRGIDPGWGHNVGRARETAMTALQKLETVPPVIAARAPAALPNLLPAAAGEFRTWA